MRVTVTPEQIRAAFEPVKDSPDFAESRALFDQAKLPLEMIQAMCLRPEILWMFGRMGECIYPGGLIERSIKEYVIIESSRLNQCQFCRDSHIDFAKMLGISDDPIASMDRPDSLTQRERLSIEYTRAAMADSNRVPDELFDRLKEHFSDAEIVELTFLIGFINMLNLFNNCMRVAYHGECRVG